MLKTEKSISISGSSQINGQQVMIFSANIKDTTQNASINSSVMNQELYEANKAEARVDLAAFNTLVFENEDALEAESEANAEASAATTENTPS